MRKFLSFFCLSLFSLTIFLSPLTAFASDYGGYFSDTVEYPTDDLPEFNSYLFSTANYNKNAFIFYNSADSCFYLITCQAFENNSNYTATLSISSDNLRLYLKKARCKIYKLDTTISTPLWQNTYNDYWDLNTTTITVCPVSQNFKSKFVWCLADYNYNITLDGITYTVTSDSSLSGAQYIYANFFDSSTGRYLGDTNNDGGTGGESGGGGGSYNDSSFKGLVTELFDHLFDVLLYGDESDYNGTAVDDSIEWLENLSDDMEDITVKLNAAPSYISGGFTAITSAQSAVNDFFTGISSAVPVLYYGIVGLLNIIIIRKIIGR